MQPRTRHADRRPPAFAPGWVLACLLLGSCQCAALAAEAELARRADLGAAIAVPGNSQPARIVRFRPASVLEQAGLQAGDLIVEANGVPASDSARFGRILRRAKGGETLSLGVQRKAERLTVEVRPPPMRTETIAGLDIRYGAALSDQGYRVRTYVSRPSGAKGRLPLVVFIPWLSCGPVENPFGPYDGIGKVLETVMRESGMQVVRLEKPGLGDSEGPDCSESDLEHDLAAFRAGIRAALADPGVDPARLVLFGGSIGASLAPVLAREFAPKAIVSAGGFSRTWLEHMLDIERRRLTLSGAKPGEVNAAMKGFAEFYDLTLREGLTPAEAIARRPHLGKIWYDAPGTQYGRPMRYYRQLQALDVEGAWAEVSAPTLVVWGDLDWIMGRDEAERAVEILRARDPALVTYELRRGMDHHFDVYPDARKAFAEEGGRYDEGAAGAIVAWLKARL